AAIEWVSHSAGLDLSQFDPTTPINDVVDQGKGPSRRLARLIDAQDLTIAEAAQLFARNDLTPEIVGSPQEIADELTNLFESGAADGFILTATHFPRGLDDFASSVVPLLQDRGVFRREYTGTTLRSNIFDSTRTSTR
ncbi:MAG: nitrilotriacetate monooxygenase, partial [Rhodococcus sp. (in: high G+C Gram-positive bacteria)]|nr:nitrilotriacetate monooxygenase [Rhodococcus sp. (in: high G+C Gram-positive bacteria)]